VRVPNEKPIALIGMPAAYKSTVAKLVATRIGRVYVDTDRVVENDTGMTVQQIFDVKGEEEFRRHEADALVHAMKIKNVLIATGGGIVLKEQNRALLSTCFVIYLHATPSELVKRLDGSRPLLEGDSIARLRELYKERKDLYLSLAHVKFTTSGKSSRRVAEEIIEYLSK
jgi:shikimate kinase